MLRVIAMIVAVGVGVWIAWSASDDAEEKLWRDAGGADGVSAEVGTGIFRFGAPYLDGRSAWMRARFDADVAEFDPASVGGEPVIEVVVRNEPFTQGPWLANLGSHARRQRTTAERRSIESSVRLHVPDASPRRVALMLAVGGVIKWTGASGEYQHSVHLTAPSPRPLDLKAVPKDEMGVFLVRQAWRGGGLARATATWLIHRLERVDRLVVLRWQLWSNAGNAQHVAVRMDAGQVIVAEHPKNGTVLWLHAYYRGQTFPNMLASLALKRTREYHALWCEVVRERAPTWRTDGRTMAWAKNLGL